MWLADMPMHQPVAETCVCLSLRFDASIGHRRTIGRLPPPTISSFQINVFSLICSASSLSCFYRNESSRGAVWRDGICSAKSSVCISAVIDNSSSVEGVSGKWDYSVRFDEWRILCTVTTEACPLLQAVTNMIVLMLGGLLLLLFSHVRVQQKYLLWIIA